MLGDIQAKLRLKEFFTCCSSTSFIPEKQVLCHRDFRGVASHHDSSVTHTRRGRVGVVVVVGGRHTDIQKSHCACRGEAERCNGAKSGCG